MATPRNLGKKRHSAVHVYANSWTNPKTNKVERIAVVKVGELRLSVNLDAKEFVIFTAGLKQVGGAAGAGGKAGPNWPPDP